jgi:3-hydroxyisobutyrate dehydrogenase-like beta-hydroxyacid dehydrogenase
MLTGGVIGLGQIGGGVALCLARAGILSAVYDIRSDAADHLDGVPAVSTSPADVARQSDVIFIAVVSAAQAIDVLTGDDGLLTGVRPGAVVVLLSTVSLEDLDAIREMTQAAGVPLIDAGVAGGPQSAKKGMILLAGGTKPALDHARPVLDAVCKYVAHMGGPGAGMIAKIARNTVMIGCQRAGYEGAALAKVYGVDMEQFVRVMLDADDTGIGPMMFPERKGDPATDPQEARERDRFRAIMVKDMHSSIKLASRAGMHVPLIQLTLATADEIFGFAAHR